MNRASFIKNMITAGLVIGVLCHYATIFFQLGTRQSNDAAAGFLIGLLFMALLWVQVKCLRLLYDVVAEWWRSSRYR